MSYKGLYKRPGSGLTKYFDKGEPIPDGWVPIETAAQPTSLSVELPPSVVKYKDDLRRFFDAMVYKLDRNAHKGRWEDLTLMDALKRAVSEMGELNEAINKKKNMVEILLEAADVANFAMIAAAIAIEKGDTNADRV